MAENEVKKDVEAENQTEDKDSGIVTKESLCAVGAIFSFLAFLILCTRSLVFGRLGLLVHSFFTGFLGYLSYPVVLGVLYLCVMGLIGKRLVKDRRVGTFVALSIVFVSLIVHTAITYGWAQDGYLTKCFKAGENFPNATVCGWVGGLLVYGLSALISKAGAIAVFAVFAILSVLLCVIFAQNASKEEKADSQTVTQTVTQVPLQTVTPTSNSNTVTAVEIPIMQPTTQPNGQALPTQQPSFTQTDSSGGVAPTQTPQAEEQDFGFGYGMPQVGQRPGVTLQENEQPVAIPKNNAFSPFGMPNSATEQNAPRAWTAEESRAFLFGGTPRENFERNLLFDPNSNVNRRTSGNGVRQQSEQGYTPSYSASYEQSLNEGTETRPTRILQDNTQTQNVYRTETPMQPYGGGQTAQSISPQPQYSVTEESAREPVAPITATPVEPILPTRIEPMETQDSTPTSTSATREEPMMGRESFGREETPFETMRDETTRDERENGRGRRHEYMDLFSLDNPNVFGQEETERDLLSDRNSGRLQEPESEERSRDGLRLFDDETEEDDTYSRRSGFDVERSFERGTDRTASDAERRVEPETPSKDRFVEDVARDIPMELPTRTVQPSAPIEPPKPIEQPKPTPPKPRVIRPYVRVPIDDFDCRDVEPTSNMEEVEETKKMIIEILEDFKIPGATITSVTFGPTVTRYNVAIPRHISPKKVLSVDQSLAIGLHSSGVNVYPNYDDGVVSIEVPNKVRQFVQLGCMLTGDTFVNAKPSALKFAMGKDVANQKIYGDITEMTHLLVAGSSGSGKSVFLGSLIISLIYKYSPEELRLILIDPKKTEFVLYNDLPHLMINEIITDVNKAIQSLNWAIGEMNRRYGLFEQMSRAGTYVVKIDEYNKQVEKKDRLPKIVIIIDELADLMLAAKKDIEDRIQNLTQKARAAGIHLIVATQRPSIDVITGVIKSNLPTRIAFGVATDVDSRVILDQTGAQKLLGKGDFLYTMQGVATPVRVQSPFISSEDSQRVVNFIKNNNEAYFDEEATAYINNKRTDVGGDATVGGQSGDIDPLCIEALRYAIITGSASISMIQRKCSAGYNRAGKIVEWMEEMKYISPFDGAKARKVLITKEQFEEIYGPLE